MREKKPSFNVKKKRKGKISLLDNSVFENIYFQDVIILFFEVH